MAGLFEIQVDGSALRRVEKTVSGIRNGMARVIPVSMNRTAAWSKTRMKREVAAQLKVPVAYAARIIPIYKATRTDWMARVMVYNARVPLVRFATGQDQAGIHYQTTEGQAVMPHAFFATMPTGHRGVFLGSKYAKLGKPTRREKRYYAAGPGFRGGVLVPMTASLYGGFKRMRVGWTELPIYERFLMLHKVIDLGWLPPLAQAASKQLEKEMDSNAKYLAEKAAK